MVGKDFPGTKHLRKRDGLVLLPLLKLGGGIDHDDVGVSVGALVDDLGEFGVSASHFDDVCLCRGEGFARLCAWYDRLFADVESDGEDGKVETGGWLT